MSPAINRESAKRMRRCLSAMLSKQPFFGSLALRLPLTESAEVKNIASDGDKIFYNPSWVAENHADLVKYGIARVVLACALKHHTRRGERDKGAWQRASEQVTMPILRSSGLTDDDGGLDCSVEQAYIEPEDNDGGDGDGEGDGNGHGGGGIGEIQDHPALGEDDGGDGNNPPATPPQSVEKKIQEAEAKWDEAMHQANQMAKAAAAGKKAGDATSGIDDLIEGAHQSRVNWRVILRRFMSASKKADYSWSMPNRRHIDSGLYLPSLRSEGMPPIVFAIDTSFSLDEDALRRLWAEIRAVVTELEPEYIHIIQCDSRVHNADKYTAFDLPVNLKIKGRGGTRFTPVFDKVAEMERPACLIYCTDLECSDYPDVIPSYPVLWAAIDGDCVADKPPFGEVIRVD